MAELNCPYCGSDQIETEAALQSPKSNTSIGRWRIGCGYTMFGIVLVMGIVSLLFRQIWMAGALAIPGMWIALAAFFFVILGEPHDVTPRCGVTQILGSRFDERPDDGQVESTVDSVNFSMLSK